MPTSSRNRKRRTSAQGHSARLVTIVGCIAGAFCLVVVLACVVGATWLLGLPDYSDIRSYANTGITTVYANDRQTVLAKLYLENRIEVAQDEVSPYVFEGTVATEDERFYEHGGIDPIGIARALFVNAASGGASEGASTITQQLVRNTVLLDEMTDRTIKRKVREMYIASQAERQYSKDEILLMYVNVVNYGDGCYGIEAASRDYFGKHASELTLSEAALLVGIPQSPNANNPREHMDNAMARRAVVLQRMLSNGYITQSEYDAVINDTPVLSSDTVDEDTVADIAPYFIDYVRNQLDSNPEFPATAIARGGLSVYTTLDPSLQEDANNAIRQNIRYMDSEFDASLVSVDPDDGAIVSMVGGKDYETSKFNLATQMSRQAGSSFKTFTLLSALGEGLDPDNTYIDSSSPVQVGKDWTVSNSEGHGYGSMSVTSATTSSVNTVYAQLVHAIGAGKTAEVAHACGIKSNLVDDDTITLGTSGVNPLEMASAYATIANGGFYHEPYCVTRITDSSGETVYEHEASQARRAISAAVAQKATQILETVISYGSGTGARLSSGQPCAGKTGTSEHGRDLWFCGFTPQLSTAVWAGYVNEKETSMYGGTICAPIWRDFMNAALAGKPVEQFPTTSERINYKPSRTWDFTKDVTIIGGDDYGAEEPEEQRPEEQKPDGNPDQQGGETGENGNSGNSGNPSDPSHNPGSTTNPSDPNGSGSSGGSSGGSASNPGSSGGTTSGGQTPAPSTQ